MLPLDSPRWDELDGASPELVDLLQRLPELDDDEQSELFWSHLLHQGDVYHATFAALPYVWAAMRVVSDGSTHRHLCSSAVNNGFDPKYLPADVGEHFRAWLAQAKAEAVAALERPCADRTEVLELLAIVGAGTPLAHALNELAYTGASLYCTCGKFINVDLRDDVLTIVGGAPPVPASVETLGTVERELHDLARSAGRADVAGYILGLSGTGTCPHCGTTSPVLDPNEDDDEDE